MKLEVPVFALMLAIFSFARAQTVGPAQAGTVGSIYVPTLHTFIRNGGELNVENYVVAAGGTYAGDITRAFDAVVAASYATQSTIYVPQGHVCVSHQETVVGLLRGDGQYASFLAPCSTSSIPAGQAIIRLGYRLDEIGRNPGWTGSPHGDLRDIQIKGLGTFPLGHLTGRTSDLGAYQGDCVHVDDLNNNTFIENASIGGCLKGVNIDTGGGHVSIRNSTVVGSFDNVYISNDTGDYKFIDDDFAGALMASIATEAVDPPKTSGIVGATFLHSHMGFAPYGFRIESGKGGGGLAGVTFIDSPFEDVGNECIHIGRNTGLNGFRTSSGVYFRNSGCAFDTADTTYQIRGNVDYPVQDFAMVWDFVGGTITFDPSSIFPVGTTGYIGYVNHPQADIYYGGGGASGLWKNAGGTIKSGVGSGMIMPNTTLHDSPCPTYYNGEKNDDRIQNIEPRTDCYFDAKGSQHWSLPVHADRGIVLPLTNAPCLSTDAAGIVVSGCEHAPISHPDGGAGSYDPSTAIRWLIPVQTTVSVSGALSSASQLTYVDLACFTACTVELPIPQYRRGQDNGAPTQAFVITNATTFVNRVEGTVGNQSQVLQGVSICPRTSYTFVSTGSVWRIVSSPGAACGE